MGLPAGVVVFERGWLSSNNILLRGRECCALVDSGYGTHAQQTCALVARELGGRPLDLLVNTHLHSDHCGGNAALQAAHPAVRTVIPPGQSGAVARWDIEALTYAPTGQHCERFRFDALLQPGTTVVLGDDTWEIHAAPGHDPHSVVLFEPHSRALISADALWENGFGIVFPELEGEAAFDEVAATLDMIGRLQARWVIPGHGPVFGDADGVAVEAALARARSRLAGFVANPLRHARHAAKVLLKFKLLEVQQQPWREFSAWAQATPYLVQVSRRYFGAVPLAEWIAGLAGELAHAGVAELSDGEIRNA